MEETPITLHQETSPHKCDFKLVPKSKFVKDYYVKIPVLDYQLTI